MLPWGPQLSCDFVPAWKRAEGVGKGARAALQQPRREELLHWAGWCSQFVQVQQLSPGQAGMLSTAHLPLCGRRRVAADGRGEHSEAGCRGI